jgi:hypothetical protein
MVTQNDATSPASEPCEVVITYRGDAARDAAEGMGGELKEAGLSVAPVGETGQEQDRLGAAEIVVTLVLAPLAHAAAKALAVTAINYIKEYAARRVRERGGEEVKVQLVVKAPDKPLPQRFPFSLRAASAEAVENFFEQVKKAVEKM